MSEVLVRIRCVDRHSKIIGEIRETDGVLGVHWLGRVPTDYGSTEFTLQTAANKLGRGRHTIGFICYDPSHGVGGLQHPIYTTNLHEAVRKARRRGRSIEIKVGTVVRYDDP